MQIYKNRDDSEHSLWRLTAAGFCGNLVCIGLARFGYDPLLPTIIDKKWFDASSAAYLGAANLAGYPTLICKIRVERLRLSSPYDISRSWPTVVGRELLLAPITECSSDSVRLWGRF